MRNFGEADKKKKATRIKMPENPAGLSQDAQDKLAEAVKSSLKDGHLPCGVAFKIAKDAGVARIAVGEMTDRLGIRVSNCQIGCFKVDKLLHAGEVGKEVDESILARLEALRSADQLTCISIHNLAQELKLAPMAVANVANARDMKVHQCQLGCF